MGFGKTLELPPTPDPPANLFAGKGSVEMTQDDRRGPAERARFRRAAPDAEGNSPMGLGLSAAADGTLGWSDVLAMVQREGLPAPGARTP